jgi:hypothetical protein
LFHDELLLDENSVPVRIPSLVLCLKDPGSGILRKEKGKITHSEPDPCLKTTLRRENYQEQLPRNYCVSELLRL